MQFLSVHSTTTLYKRTPDDKSSRLRATWNRHTHTAVFTIGYIGLLPIIPLALIAFVVNNKKAKVAIGKIIEVWGGVIDSLDAALQVTTSSK